MLRSIMLASFVASLGASAGCSTVLKQTYYTATGAKGDFYEIEVVDPDALVAYKSIRIEPFTNSLGEHVPDEVMEQVHAQAPRTVEESYLFYPTGSELLVRGQVVHFTGESGLMGSVRSVIGGSEECVCRVQLHDAATGSKLGEAVCWGTVKSAIRRGAEELGAGVGKALVKWFEERLPQEVVESRREELRPE